RRRKVRLSGANLSPGAICPGNPDHAKAEVRWWPLSALLATRADQVRAAVGGQFFRLFAAPSLDFLMIAGKQDVRDRPALPVPRFGELRVLKKARLEAFAFEAFGGADHARKKPHAGFDQDHRRDFAARQDVIADRD